MLQARLSLILSRHFSLSFIASGRSSGSHPVSSHSCWMYVRAGHPAFARPYVGVQAYNRISASNEQLQQVFKYTLLKPDCHSWWISKRQSGREDTLEEQYAIKFCFRLGKNATEMYWILQTAFWPSCMNQASVFERHKKFKEGRESVRDDERCGRSKEVNTPELIDQRVTVRVKVTMLRF